MYDVGSATNDWTDRINGQLQFTSASNTPVFTNLLYLGTAGSSGRYFDGDIAELLVFDRELTAAERDAVGLYLNQKYAFTATTPLAPTNLTLTVIDSISVELTWRSVSTNASSFQIERGIGTNSFAAYAVVPGNVTNYTDVNLTDDLPYSYRVKARNYAGDSGYSNVATRPPDSDDDGIGDPSGVTTTGNNSVINLQLYTPLK